MSQNFLVKNSNDQISKEKEEKEETEILLQGENEPKDSGKQLEKGTAVTKLKEEPKTTKKEEASQINPQTANNLQNQGIERKRKSRHFLEGQPTKKMLIDNSSSSSSKLTFPFSVNDLLNISNVEPEPRKLVDCGNVPCSFLEDSFDDFFNPQPIEEKTSTYILNEDPTPKNEHEAFLLCSYENYDLTHTEITPDLMFKCDLTSNTSPNITSMYWKGQKDEELVKEVNTFLRTNVIRLKKFVEDSSIYSGDKLAYFFLLAFSTLHDKEKKLGPTNERFWSVFQEAAILKEAFPPKKFSPEDLARLCYILSTSRVCQAALGSLKKNPGGDYTVHIQTLFAQNKLEKVKIDKAREKGL